MAWNGSDATANHNAQKPHRPAGRRRRRVALPLTIVLTAVVVLALFFVATGRGKSSKGQAKPAPTRTAGKVRMPKAGARPSPSVHDAAVDDAQGAVPLAPASLDMPADATEARPPNVIVNDGSHRPQDRYAALSLNCDKQIAGLLYAVPGQLMIGTVDFDEDFEKQFTESLKAKLEPGQDATEEELEMIEAVNEAKDAIVKAMKAEGKTAGEVLSETRQQLREFGQYKYMLAQELRRYESDEDKTDEDVSDLFDAANIILKENGIEPFSPNDLTREVVRQYKFDQQEKEEQ